MAIATNGTTIDTRTGATGQTAIALTTTAIGDLLILGITVEVYTITVSALSGGGADGRGWKQLVTPLGTSGVGFSMNFWYCTVGTAGSVTLNVTYSSAIGTTQVRVAGQEFSGAAYWIVNGTPGTVNNTGSVTAISFPTLTTAQAGELYFGYTVPGQSGAVGSTSGFTYYLDGDGDVLCWDTSSSGSMAPTCTQTPAGPYYSSGALFIAGSSPLLNTPPMNRARLTRAANF